MSEHHGHHHRHDAASHEHHAHHSAAAAPGQHHRQGDHHDHGSHHDHGNHHAHDSHQDHAGHGGHHGHGDHVAQFRKLFFINLVIAIPVVACSPMFGMLIGYELPTWTIWVAATLGTVMYVWGGWPFLSGGISEIRARQPGMMLLISLGITVAFLASWAATLGIVHHELEFWWELAMLVVIMLLGHWIEMRSLAQTTSALDSLAALLPDEAERVQGDEVVRVSPTQLRVNDVVVVRPGGSIPADGVIVDGEAAIDESMITGESKTVTRGLDQHVTAGTVATDSGLRIRVTATGDDTTLAGINRLVAVAQSSSSRAQRIADRAAAWLFWFALGAAVITAVVWLALGDPDAAVMRTITVLVIACPHALGLAIPLVVSIATERAARGGVLIKDRLALESMRQVGAVLFDKTGTLTKGEPVVTRVIAAANPTSAKGRVAASADAAGDPLDEDAVLSLAAAAEADSEHPLARAIVAAAVAKGLTVPAASGFSSSPAVGVTATIGEHEVRVGGPYLLHELGLSEAEVAGSRQDGARSNEHVHDDPTYDDSAQDRSIEGGATTLYVVCDGLVVGQLKLADEIRSESREAVDALHHLGIEVATITGDAEAVAKSVAAQLGIDRVFAGVRPEDKAAKVAELQHEGMTVAMVGDGVNDAPALAQADVGIAIGAGTDVAIASAGVVLASSDPRSVLSVIELSRAAYRKMRQNLWWAAGYNLVSVPLAAGVLAPIGFIMPMSVGAILMSISTIVVALNAQLLRRLDLSPDARSRT